MVLLSNCRCQVCGGFYDATIEHPRYVVCPTCLKKSEELSDFVHNLDTIVDTCSE